MRVGFGALLGASALVTILVAPAAAQETRLAGRLSEEARARVDSILEAAHADALPLEPLVDRALEGLAKGAPPHAIVVAVARLRDELRVARATFGAPATTAELVAGASALRAGARADDLARLRRLRRGQSLIVAAAVLADLVATGVPADTAITAVLALAKDAGDADYVAFRRNVQRDIALGASPAAALGVRLRAAVEVADAPGTTQGTGATRGPRKQKP